MTAVQTATAVQQDLIVDVIVRAFSADPTARWLWPQDEKYHESFPEFVVAFAGGAFLYGTAHYAGDVEGAALWLPPGAHPDEKTIVDVIERTVPESRRADVFGMFEEMDRYHPGEPLWYLPVIGVDPAHHRKGIGSSLLSHALARCDAGGMPAYLESTNPRNVPLYERHGFVRLGEIQVGSSPPMVPMLREPRS